MEKKNCYAINVDLQMEPMVIDCLSLIQKLIYHQFCLIFIYLINIALNYKYIRYVSIYQFCKQIMK